jgi:hypothetical protein
VSIHVTPRADLTQPLRCAICHGEGGAELETCMGCKTRVHLDCRLVSVRCPTFGCTAGQDTKLDPATRAQVDELAARARRAEEAQARNENRRAPSEGGQSNQAFLDLVSTVNARVREHPFNPREPLFTPLPTPECSTCNDTGLELRTADRYSHRYCACARGTGRMDYDMRGPHHSSADDPMPWALVAIVFAMFVVLCAAVVAAVLR